VEEDLVGDKWTSLFKMLSKLMAGKEASGLSDEAMAALSEIADFQKMNEIRTRAASIVARPTNGRTAQTVVRAVV